MLLNFTGSVDSLHCTPYHFEALEGSLDTALGLNYPDHLQCQTSRGTEGRGLGITGGPCHCFCPPSTSPGAVLHRSALMAQAKLRIPLQIKTRGKKGPHPLVVWNLPTLRFLCTCM